MSDNKNPFTRAGEIADQKFAEIIARPGRKPKTTVIEPDPVVDQGRVDNAMTVMRTEVQTMSQVEQQLSATARAVAAQVGYQLPAECVDPDLIQRDIAANMRRSVEACLEVGRGLTVLKAACHHGMFMARLDVLNIEHSVAKRFMQAAMKFSNGATSHLLKAAGNQSKLFEMLVLDDDQLDELELTGQTGELKLDDVATMSVKELRAKVRELKGDVSAKEEVLSRRATQVNDLEEKLARVKTLPADEVRAELQREATAHLNDTRGALIGKFCAAIAALYEHADTTGAEQDVAYVAGLVGQLQSDLTALRDRFGIPDISPALIPEWVNDPAFGANAE